MLERLVMDWSPVVYPSATMPSIVTLEIPAGSDLDPAIVLAAVSIRVGAVLEYEDGDSFARLRFPEAPYPVALTKTKRALFMADPNGEHVRVLEGQ